MRKSLYIHIGPPKTGTSVIQFWLNNSVDWLATHGVYYPVHDVDINSVSSGHRALFLEKRSDTTRTQFNHDKFQALLAEFEATKCSTLLLSSEFFFYQVPQFLQYQKDYNIRLVAYVRADVELVESLYNQSVKRNRQVKPLAARSKLPKSYLDDLIDFMTVYPPELFCLRAYGNGDVLDPNIQADLLSAIGLPHNSEKQSLAGKINSSYSFECLEVKRWLNHFDLTNIDSQIDLYLQGYVGNRESYTLLPANVYKAYVTQSLEKINKLHSISGVHNYTKLVKYLSEKQRNNYIHQELYPSHLEKVARYLIGRNRNLVKILVNQIEQQVNEQKDKERLDIIKDAMADVPSKQNLFTKIKRWVTR